MDIRAPLTACNTDEFETIITSLPGHVYWMDTDCVIQSCNESQAHFAGFSSSQEMIGKTDYDMPWAKHADQIIANNKKIIETGQSMTFQETVKFPGKLEIVFLSKKKPSYNKEGELIGLLGVSINITAEKNLSRLKNNPIILSSKKYSSVEFNSQTLSYSLTPREFECLFYLLRGKTTKTISKIFNVSPSTIAFHLKNLKLKFNCYSKSQLTSKAIEKGFFEKTSSLLLTSGHTSSF